MRTGRRGRLALTGKLVSAVAVAALVAGCTSAPQPKSMVSKSRSKEYFAESEYGVKASPRVSNKRSGLKRGGGREQVGKAYKVKGKWYKPKEEPGYVKMGAASWYGDAFHGRLTANGEIYDMTHLTAAHPTMPLPSYARVTNTTNGSSIIVRVNDRGPFASDRIIDLSKRAAQLLDYTHAGVTKVKVEYVGRAPLHGQDDQYLMASYRPGGNGVPLPDDGLPTGVMVAMAGPTPTSAVGDARKAVVFPGQLTTSAPGSLPQPAVMAASVTVPMEQAVPAVMTDAMPADLVLPADFSLPTAGPVLPERPGSTLIIAQGAQKSPRMLGYADIRVARASQAVEAFAGSGMSPADIVSAWQSSHEGDATALPAAPYITAGTFAGREDAGTLAAKLDGRVVRDGGDWSVVLTARGAVSLDDMLEFAWSHGAGDAFIVRD